MRFPPATLLILHFKSKAQAQVVLDAIVERLAQVGLELNLDKTRIVYCKDSNPAVADDAAKAIRRRIKCWRLHLWSGQSLADIARAINPVVRGWINYYGRFYRTRLVQTLRRIDEYLVRWAMRKYKRLRKHPTRTWALLARISKREPELFAHWTMGARPKTG